MFHLLLLSLTVFTVAVSIDPRGPPLCGTPFAITSRNLDTWSAIVNGTTTLTQRSSDLLSEERGPRQWPRNPVTNKVVIPYCFNHMPTRDKIGQAFREHGIAGWMNALGGEASRASGHGVVFEETTDHNGQPLTCLHPDGEWDDRVDIDAVYVYWDPAPGIVAGATVGYVNYDLQYRQYGVHRMGIGELWTGPSITHELGHIMGMTHEHQRQDRDEYVEYRCHNIRNYNEAFRSLLERNPAATESDLCDSLITALEFKFSGLAFVKGQGADPRPYTPTVIRPIMDHGEPYDFDSIMHYGSAFGKHNDLVCNPDFTAGCTLVKRGPNDEEDEEEYIAFSERPSAGDLHWVRETYWWLDPPSGVGLVGRNFTA